MEDLRKTFAEACLAVAADRGWRAATLFEIAGRAGVSVATLYPLTPADAFDVTDEYFDRLAAARVSAPDMSAATRDRVFDAAMSRFEAMEESRAGALALEEALDRDAIGRAASFARLTRTARWLLALAGENAEGLANAARVQSLAMALSQAKAAWRQDEAGDFAKTMAALDKALRRADSFFEQVGKVADVINAGFKPRPKAAAEGSPSDRPAD